MEHMIAKQRKFGNNCKHTGHHIFKDNTNCYIGVMSMVLGLGVAGCQPMSDQPHTSVDDALTYHQQGQIETPTIEQVASIEDASAPLANRINQSAGNSREQATFSALHNSNNGNNGDDGIERVTAPRVKRTPEVTAVQVVQSIELSQARMAANSRDKCPKLLAKEVDSNVIVRKGEMLRGKHCDYYLLPTKGELITVGSLPKTVKATLIAPVAYDFANGAYEVQESIRHDIRLSYEGSGAGVEPVDYDMAVVFDNVNRT